ncbi:sporulation protein [Ferrimonas sediminicola]|uniref:Sporulation protein n=1 Tax=Ferrimonas sediminicola TaxID=2569538 RepID=A0A4U1BD81_9GAMM|nr:sporulation protein [Ferrimonas sediminicola]TKB49039.1 sporulation protein [Ferrimonas sediminicola]
MLKKLLASVGIGAAKVDTQLHQEVLMPGQPFSATIVIQGGEVDQAISGLTLTLVTEAKAEVDDATVYQPVALDSWRLSETMTIEAGQTYELPFEGVLHPETPITTLGGRRNQSKVWLQTGLEVDLAVDPSDRDMLAVAPTPAMETLVAAMEQAGYRLHKADVERGHLNGAGFSSQSGAYQELEFIPAGISLFGVREVEVSFVPQGGRMNALIEVDRAFRGDSYKSLSWDDGTDLPTLLAQLKRALG